MSEDAGIVIVVLMMVGVGAVVIYFIVLAALSVLGVTIAIGSSLGGGVSLYNYGLALKNNIQPERPTR